MIKTVAKSCLTCQISFQAPLKEIRRGNGKYCSLRCSVQANSIKFKKLRVPNTTCAWCAKEFWMPPRRKTYSKSGLNFCTRLCKDHAQRLGGLEAIQPDHYGTGTSVHYRALALRSLPNRCASCSFEQVPEVLEVNHKDFDRSNNRLSNLEILCPTCHQIYHFRTGTGRWASKK